MVHSQARVEWNWVANPNFVNDQVIPVTAGLARRAAGSVLAGIYVLAALILFWYFYPILAGKIIPYSDWLSHMWYTGLLGPATGWI